MPGFTEGDEGGESRPNCLKIGLAKANITKVAKKKGIDTLKRYKTHTWLVLLM